MNGIYYSTIRIVKIKRVFAKRRNIDRNIDHIGYGRLLQKMDV